MSAVVRLTLHTKYQVSITQVCFQCYYFMPTKEIFVLVSREHQVQGLDTNEINLLFQGKFKLFE